MKLSCPFGGATPHFFRGGFDALAAGLRRLRRRKEWWHGRAGRPNRIDGYCWERASDVDLDREHWCDQLLREAVDSHRRPLHANSDAGRHELHRHGLVERDEILLRRVRL